MTTDSSERSAALQRAIQTAVTKPGEKTRPWWVPPVDEQPAPEPPAAPSPLREVIQAAVTRPGETATPWWVETRQAGAAEQAEAQPPAAPPAPRRGPLRRVVRAVLGPGLLR